MVASCGFHFLVSSEDKPLLKIPRSAMTMNYPYPSFFLDVQLAEKRLANALATGSGVSGDDLFAGSNLAEINEQRSERIQFSARGPRNIS
jgi:hypothetical protein